MRYRRLKQEFELRIVETGSIFSRLDGFKTSHEKWLHCRWFQVFDSTPTRIAS